MTLKLRPARVVKVRKAEECVFCRETFRGEGVPMRSWSCRRFVETWACVPCAKKPGSGTSLIHFAR
ncbi:MAG TPA: hypothetical protein VM529_15730 [Gemmata sp.]|nr:hypothetical protein [Gemmata sp.]